MTSYPIPDIEIGGVYTTEALQAEIDAAVANPAVHTIGLGRQSALVLPPDGATYAKRLRIAKPVVAGDIRGGFVIDPRGGTEGPAAWYGGRLVVDTTGAPADQHAGLFFLGDVNRPEIGARVIGADIVIANGQRLNRAFWLKNAADVTLDAPRVFFAAGDRIEGPSGGSAGRSFLSVEIGSSVDVYYPDAAIEDPENRDDAISARGSCRLIGGVFRNFESLFGLTDTDPAAVIEADWPVLIDCTRLVYVKPSVFGPGPMTVYGATVRNATMHASGGEFWSLMRAWAATAIGAQAGVAQNVRIEGAIVHAPSALDLVDIKMGAAGELSGLYVQATCYLDTPPPSLVKATGPACRLGIETDISVIT